MLYPNGNTFLEQYGRGMDAEVAKQQLRVEGNMENLSTLFAERALEIVFDKGVHSIKVGRDNEKFILDSLQQIGRKNTPNMIEQYTWWVSCVEREADLLDEYARNNALYAGLLIEAKLCLQELRQYKNGNIPGNSIDLINGGKYEEQYWDIIMQMNKMITINHSIKIHLDSSDFE